MTATKHEILINLRRVAEAAPEDLLHMTKVVHYANCGTARCLLGWAIIDPWFRANTPIGEEIRETYDWGGIPPTATPLNEIFCLDEEDCEHLFAYGDGELESNNPHCVSKAEVLSNIDSLLIEGWAFRYDAASISYDEDEGDNQ